MALRARPRSRSRATVKVTPETASPRDFIVISGENWPISTAELDNSVTIEIDARTRNADVDSTGRFRLRVPVAGHHRDRRRARRQGEVR